MNDKLLPRTICYLSHTIMVMQAINTEDAFKLCCCRFPELLHNRDIFDEAVKLCKEYNVFTGISNGYLYQTISVVTDKKTVKEITEMVSSAKEGQ